MERSKNNICKNNNILVPLFKPSLFKVVFFSIFQFMEAVLQKKVFLDISQISQENTCVEVSFYLKENPTQVLSNEICEIFKNTYFEEHL